MFLNKKPADFDVVIGAKAVINGDIDTEGSICIDGKVNGNIKTNGDVIISENASLTGNIKAYSVDIYGSCIGDIETVGDINVNASATLKGDAKCGSIKTAPGCEFSGNLTVVPTQDKGNRVEHRNENKKSPDKNGKQ
ncbi:MAG: polymer-forming cytoskeletal protein [Bacillota bacterium]|nr:polymer-forming cytoskeletal protein [Bacillota bacterium]